MAEDRLLKDVMKELEGQLKGVEGKMADLGQRIVMNCFSRSAGNSDRFVDCALDSQERLNKLGEKTMMRAQYMQISLAHCLQNSSEEQCRKAASEHIHGIISAMQKEHDSLS
jgi:hypothetical protein